jgi:NAD(P)-dependent dehydrogenase (short-subunit alcohol dehydrogenase family)
MTNLSGKTALVTGASRGIGRSTALALAKAGAQVLVHYSSGQAEAQAVVADIRAAGGRADAIGADLAAPDGAHKVAKQVRSLVGARLDILVANAGVAASATIEETTVEDFDRMFAVNVRAPFFLVQQLLPILGKGGRPCLGRHALRLLGHQGRHRHVGEALRRSARRARRSGQCRGARRRRHRHVQVRENRCRA